MGFKGGFKGDFKATTTTTAMENTTINKRFREKKQ